MLNLSMTRLLATFRNPMAVIFSIAAFGLIFGTFFALGRSNKIQIFNRSAAGDSQNYQEILQGLKNQTAVGADIKFQQNLTQNLATKLADLITDGAKENLGNIPPEEALRQVGANQIEKTFNEFIKASKPIVIPVIMNSDLKITGVNSKEAVNNYLADLAIVFNRNFADKAFDQTSDEVLADALKTNDFSKAVAYSQIYDRLFGELKTVWVPSSWLSIHKQWMQIFSLKAQIMAASSQVDNDAIRALIALKTYQNLFDFEDGLRAQIGDLMKKQGIK